MSGTRIITQSDLMMNPIRYVEALASVNAKEGVVPKHSKQIKSTQQRLYGINCPCGAGCTFNNNPKAQRMWIKLHKKKCPLAIKYETPNQDHILHFVSK